MADVNNATAVASARAVTLSFDEAFTLHHRAVFRAARSVVHDTAQAEDVTQEVFLRLYRNLDAAPGKDVLRAWLLRVTLNVARNILRTQSREKSYAAEDLHVALEEMPFIEVPDYEKRLAIEEARRALEKIEEPMRSCILLKQQGLSYREIATSLSLKETTAVTMVHRGRKEFARIYGSIGGRRKVPIRSSQAVADRNNIDDSTRPILLEVSERDRLADHLDKFVPQFEQIQSSLQSDQSEIEHLREKTRSVLALLQAR
jgi:RNA polymerase sigma-70 factor (ECF subfamily)